MELTSKQLLQGLRNARQKGINDTGVDILRRLLRTSAEPGQDIPDDWEEVLSHALAFADEDGALEVAEILVTTYPNNLKFSLLLAERLARVGRTAESLDILKQLKAGITKSPAIDYFLGVYEGQMGNVDGATPHFREALRQYPELGDAWAMLAASNGLSASDRPALEKLVSTPLSPALPGAAYALGALNHSVGNYASTWENWTLANQTERKRNRYDLASEIELGRAIRDADRRIWTNPVKQAGVMDKLPRPIFVVGAPRSGTSLTEQIISRAPGVAALGETMLSRVSTWPVGNLGPAALENVSAFDPPGATWERMGAIYRHLASARADGKTIITDKGALLHLFVGALARMMPNAKFVWVRRDHRDIALSAYRAYLSDGNRWRHDMHDAAAYLTAYDEMMHYWQASLPGRVIELQYEALVSDPQGQSDRLMTLLDLPLQNISQMNFGTSVVGTASFAQVRERISPRSVGVWRAYEPWIGPAFGKK